MNQYLTTVLHHSILRYYNGINQHPYAACHRGNLERVKYTSINLEKCLEYACSGGNIEIVHYLIKLNGIDFYKCLPCACFWGQLSIAKYLVALGAVCFDAGLTKACSTDQSNTILYMIELGATCCGECCNERHPEIPDIERTDED